jgi:hypothetical protein
MQVNVLAGVRIKEKRKRKKQREKEIKRNNLRGKEKGRTE